MTLAIVPNSVKTGSTGEAPVEDLPEGWTGPHVVREGPHVGRKYYTYPGGPNGEPVSTWSLPPNPRDVPVITLVGGRSRQPGPKKPPPALPSPDPWAAVWAPVFS